MVMVGLLSPPFKIQMSDTQPHRLRKNENLTTISLFILSRLMNPGKSVKFCIIEPRSER